MTNIELPQWKTKQETHSNTKALSSEKMHIKIINVRKASTVKKNLQFLTKKFWNN